MSAREIDFAAGPYGTVKAAIIHYIQGLAYQLAGKGIRANTVSPGNTFFDGGVWQNIESGNPDLFAHGPGAQPDRPDGHAEGDGPRGSVPGQPGGQLHHRHQPGGRRGADPRRAVLTSVPVMCSGRTGTWFSGSPVAARMAATIAGPEEIVGGSPTPRSP